MPTYSAVSCQECHGSRVETLNFGSPSARVDLYVNWTDRWSLANDILGNRRPFPYNTLLYPTEVSMRPEPGQYTGDGQGMTYERGIVSVSYGVPGGDGGGSDQPDPNDPTELAAESIEPSISFLTLDPKRFTWSVGTPLRPDEAPGKKLITMKIVRTIYQVLQLPENIKTIAGTVNDRLYHSRLLDLDFETETLLCGAPQLSRSITTQGAGAWTVKLEWEYKPETWNKFWHYETKLFEEIWYDEAPYKVYEPVDQRPLLPG